MVQELIYLQSIGERVRLARCRSYVVLVRHAKRSLSSAPTAPSCSLLTSYRLATRSSFLRWQTVSESQHHTPRNTTTTTTLVPCRVHTHSSLPTQQIIISIPHICFPRPSLRPPLTPILDHRPLRRRIDQHHTTPHLARPFTPSDLTSPPCRYPLSPPTTSSTDPRIARSSRCRYSPRLSQAGLWSDVHSLSSCVCICIHPSIHLLRASAKPPPLAQSQPP